jgi:DNA-binding transcriptional ArsR family regulator
MAKRLKKGEAPGGILGDAQVRAAAGLFGTLSEESRLRILRVLEERPATVGELVVQTGMKQANVSKQLGVLLQAGVVARERAGNSAIYSIAMPVVFDLCRIVCAGVAKRAAEVAEELGG